MSDPHRHKATKFVREDSQNAANVVITVNSPDAVCVEHISGSGDAGATVTLTIGATVVWSKVFGGAFTFSETFPPGVYVGVAGDDATLAVSAGTTGRNLNIGGYLFQAAD